MEMQVKSRSFSGENTRPDVKMKCSPENNIIKWPPDVPSPTNESYGRISVTAKLLFSGHLILYRLDYMARKHRKEIDVGDKK